MSELKSRIVAKAGSGKAFKADDDNWYNVEDAVIPYLAKINKGDNIIITYEKKGTTRKVSKVVIAGEAPATAKAEVKESTTGFACEVCRKELKDGKYKKCFACNKSGATKKEEFTCEDCGAKLKDGKYKKCWDCNKKAPKGETGKSTWTGKGKSSYDNPEKTAQIQRGNALNAAADVSSSQNFVDPEAAVQYTLLIAERFLEWLRNE